MKPNQKFFAKFIILALSAVIGIYIVRHFAWGLLGMGLTETAFVICIGYGAIVMWLAARLIPKWYYSLPPSVRKRLER